MFCDLIYFAERCLDLSVMLLHQSYMLHFVFILSFVENK